MSTVVCVYVCVCMRVCVCVCTLLGASVVRAWSRVWRIFGVSCGSTVACPVEHVIFVLREQTQCLILETTLELP